MTPNDIMEELSKDYIMTIAHNKGFFNSNSRDYGTDLTIRKAIPTIRNGTKRYLTHGKAIDIQLKAVSEKGIVYLTDSIKYKLETKNFNDLVERAISGGSTIPLVLIIFILPNAIEKYVECLQEGLIIRKEAYWYQITPNASKSDNVVSVTIEIPKRNKVDTSLFPHLFEIAWQ